MLEFLQEPWVVATLASVATAGIIGTAVLVAAVKIVKLTPSKKDDKIVGSIVKVWIVLVNLVNKIPGVNISLANLLKAIENEKTKQAAEATAERSRKSDKKRDPRRLGE